MALGLQVDCLRADTLAWMAMDYAPFVVARGGGEGLVRLRLRPLPCGNLECFQRLDGDCWCFEK